MRILLCGLALLFSTHALAKDIRPDWKYVEWRLSQIKVDDKFIKAMKDNYEAQGFEDVLELNVLLFLKKSDYHGPQITDDAVKDVQKFMRENSRALHSAQKKYKVPPAVVASLLWLESRYGQNVGRYKVANVFLHLLQSERRDVIAHLKENATRFTSRKITAKISAEIADRAKKKAKWARSELEALAKMFGRNSRMVTNLKGSFSGAFGIPQFLPSSYNHWARSASPGVAPDLTSPDDAIHSVAYYLRSAGWRGARNHVKALMRYNNSRDYANAILKLSARADTERDVTSVTTKLIKKKSKKKKSLPK
jgi:membrane-bound lytic murein transglycosylase B